MAPVASSFRPHAPVGWHCTAQITPVPLVLFFVLTHSLDPCCMCRLRAGSDGRVLGPELPFGRPKRQDPGGDRGRRVPAPGGAADPLLARRADAGPAHRRKHRHRRRPSDAGEDEDERSQMKGWWVTRKGKFEYPFERRWAGRTALRLSVVCLASRKERQSGLLQMLLVCMFVCGILCVYLGPAPCPSVSVCFFVRNR